MPRAYPTEFRTRAIALVRAGKPAKQTAIELGIHPVTLSKWLRQDDIDQCPGCDEAVDHRVEPPLGQMCPPRGTSRRGG
ncbi:transposase [Nocardia neocaledoniensis]|uniref:transposase n=1 Tax=Nocardia neocaledoniensis TaxID=236511 RepID=UPI0035A22B11